MATASGGEPEPRPSAKKERLSKKDEINALYRRRQDGEISEAESSEQAFVIFHDDERFDTQAKAKRRFWALFTGGSIAATAALVLLLYLVDPDICDDASFVLFPTLALLPVGLPVGVLGIAVRTEEGRRAWPIFVAVLLTLLWILWAIGLLLGLGLAAASCL
jgi:hypothetical protein